MNHTLIASIATACALLAGCATPLAPKISGYTCCNLRPSSDAVSSYNVQGGPIIPAGEPVTMTTKKRYHVYGSIGGADIELRDDMSNSEAETLAWVRQIIVAENPRAQLATWPADIQAAVQSAKVKPGMSKAQVLMSLGYPSKKETPKLDADVWHYWTPYDDEKLIDLHFDDKGLLTELSGVPEGVRAVSVAP
ncbi:MAG: outer membrane protein assembly factor BamE [Aquabacterium sp.]